MSLKERIAALQQRNAEERSTSPPLGTAPVAASHAGALRAKIAQFESKGGVPVPRGSFGLGAPPPQEPAQKRRGELYGNVMQPTRLPSSTLTRPTSPMPSPHPSPAPRVLSLDGDGEDQTSPPGSPELGTRFLRAISPAPASTPRPRNVTPGVATQRGTAFSTALDIARKAEADVKAERRKSSLTWLSPQHTGDRLTPQYTGDRLVPQYTGDRLAPQYTGDRLAPQYTGDRLTPQFTGDRLTAHYTGDSSAPLSPLFSPGPESPPAEYVGDDYLEQPDVGYSEEPGDAVQGAEAAPEDAERADSDTAAVPEGAASEHRDEEPQVVVEVPLGLEAPPHPALEEPNEDASMDESLLPSPVQAEVEEPNDASRDDSTPSADEDGEVEGEDVAALEDVVPHENAVPQEVYDAVPELDIMYMPMHTYRRTRMSTITELTAESPSPPSSPAALAYTVSFSPPSSPTSASVPHRTSIGERSEPPSPSPYRLSFLTERTYSPSLRESLYDAYADSPAREGLRLSADCESLNRDGTDAARDGMSIDCERDDDPLTPATMPSSNGASLAPAHLDAGKSRESLYSAYDYSPAREAFEQPLTPATPDAPTPSAHDAFPREATNPDPALLDPRDASSQRDSLQSTSSATQTLLARPRPASAIDSLASPSHVALAHRVPIPAARGVALFVPGSARLGGEGEERDDDGPPLDSRANDEPEEEFGTVSFGASTPPRARYAHAQLYTEPDLGDGHLHQHSFSAVVHGRVREGGAPSKGKGRADSHGGEKRLPLPPTPLSPGYAGNAELAELLEEAAALEQRLVAGELPGEALRRMSMGQVMSAAPVVTVLPQRSVSANAAEPGNRSGGEGGGRPAKHTFRNPLARSRSDRKAKQPKQEAHPVASSSTNNLLATASSTGTDTGSLGRSKSSANLLPAALALPPPMPMSPAASESSVPPTPPPKSPGVNGGPRYFASLRRLASTSRALSGRGSVSTSSELSSEDSMGLITPPDEATAAPGIAWPTLSPKKSGSVGSIGRGAASLAGKMWHRTRSKSTVSTTSSFEAPLPPPSLPLPAIPKIPTLELPSSDKMPFVMPIRTDSLNQEPLSASETTPGADPFVSLSMPPSAPPAKKSPPVQTRRPNLSIGPSTALSPPSLLPMPLVPDPENRRSSWMSTSSAASSFPSSPLFDKAIFDAFPSVPEMPPAQTLGTYRRMPSHGRSSSHGRGSASGTPSPSGTVPPLPISPYSDSGSTTPVSERGAYFNAGPKVLAPTSIGRGPMLGRLYTAAETQRHVSPLP